MFWTYRANIVIIAINMMRKEMPILVMKRTSTSTWRSVVAIDRQVQVLVHCNSIVHRVHCNFGKRKTQAINFWDWRNSLVVYLLFKQLRTKASELSVMQVTLWTTCIQAWIPSMSTNCCWSDLHYNQTHLARIPILTPIDVLNVESIVYSVISKK